MAGKVVAKKPLPGSKTKSSSAKIINAVLFILLKIQISEVRGYVLHHIFVYFSGFDKYLEMEIFNNF